MKHLFEQPQNQKHLWKRLSIGTCTTMVTLSAVATLLLPAGAAMAKEPTQTHHGSGGNSISQAGKSLSVRAISRGMVMQVDSSDSNNINFTLMDHQGNMQTIYLTTSTQFARNQSISGLVANAFVTVRTVTDSSGLLDAQEIMLQRRDAAAFDLKGIVVSKYVNQNQLNLALNNGTVLSVIVKNPSLVWLQPGISITLRAHINAAGAFEAANYSLSKVQSQSFTVQGGVSGLNNQTHQFILTSPSGASFSVNMSPSATLQLGEEIVVSGNIDSQGNFIEQNIIVENANQSAVEIEGMVSAIDSTANTFSLIDEEGSSFLFSADPTLLANLAVGSVYTVTASVTTGGNLQATQVSAALGNNRERKIELRGSIQSYDQSSGLLTLTGANNLSIVVQVSPQTALEGHGSSSVALLAGENVKIRAQLNTDGSYSALHIQIQGLVSNKASKS